MGCKIDWKDELLRTNKWARVCNFRHDLTVFALLRQLPKACASYTMHHAAGLVPLHEAKIAKARLVQLEA